MRHDARNRMASRAGFVMLTVLWIIVAASAVTIAGSAIGVDAAAAHKNRINATRARWHAHGCADRARYAVDAVLRETLADARDSVWRTMDSLVAATGMSTGADCTTQLVAAGTQLDVNVANAPGLERLFAALGLAAPAQLAATTMDWIDTDDLLRESGAEAMRYSALQRRGPRNGPVASVDELRYVIGLEGIALDSVLTAEPARISLANAPLPVLASLPGFGTEALARIAEWRAIGRQFTNLLVFAESLSPEGEHAIIEGFPEITRRSTIDPEAWFVRATGFAGSPRIAATAELKVVRSGARAALLRKRQW